MSRLGRTAVVIASAACLAAGFTAAVAAPALAQPAHTPTHPAKISAKVQWTYEKAAHQHPRATGPCSDSNGFTASTSFWRCTGPNPSSRWVASSCAQGQYNAGTSYNVYGAVNFCGTRVWLHEFTYPQDVNNGWSICFAPNSNAEAVLSIPVFPENIMVSNNPTSCTTILP